MPGVVEVTLTCRVQLAEAASLPPVSEIVDPPATAVSVLVEPHVPFWPFGLSTASPAGSVSVKATPLSALAFGLVMVNDSAVVPPDPIEAGVNWLAIVGGFTSADALAGSAKSSSAATIAPLNVLACVLTRVPFRRATACSTPPRRTQSAKLHNFD